MDNMSLVIVVVVVLLVVVLMYNNGSRNNSTESFVDTPSPNNESEVGSGFEIEEGFEVNEVNEVNEPFENPKPVEEGFEDESTPVNNANQLPAECYPPHLFRG